jgi:hypothetical protein
MNAQQFDGATFAPARDEARLGRQLDRVLALMQDGAWRTLRQIADATGGSEAAVSARLRDLRKGKFGAYRVPRKNMGGGLWVYRVLPPLPSGQGVLWGHEA